MTARKAAPAQAARTVAVSVKLSLAEAEALARAVFTCTSTHHWREAERALALLRQAAADSLRDRL